MGIEISMRMMVRGMPLPRISSISLDRAGVKTEELHTILDFGCGCGRVLSGWEPYLTPRSKLYGCDINPELIEFCQQNIHFAETIVSGYFPPLLYAEAQFDLVFAGSVYTHLTLPAAQQWTGEISRILKPGGVAMISFHGSYYVPEAAKNFQSWRYAADRTGLLCPFT